MNSWPGDPLELFPGGQLLEAHCIPLVESRPRVFPIPVADHWSLDTGTAAIPSRHYRPTSVRETFTAGGGVLQGAVSPCPEVQEMGWLLGSGH